MKLLIKAKALALASVIAASAIAPANVWAGTIKIALAETPSDELAAFFGRTGSRESKWRRL